MSTAQIMNKLKDECRNTSKKTCNIVQDVLGKCSNNDLNNLPSISAIKQCVYREKSKYNKQIEPDNINFEIDPDLIKIDDEIFLIKDAEYDDTKRIMLFSTRK